MCSILPG
jgi:hypothetical protein